MTDLAPGIYEQLVTHELQSHLRLLDASLADRGRTSAHRDLVSPSQSEGHLA